MPCAGGWTPLPHDDRTVGGFSTAALWTADAAWEAGQHLDIAAAHLAGYQVLGGTLGDGDTIYLTHEVLLGTTNAGATVFITQAGGTGMGAATSLSICRNTGASPSCTIFARFTDANGTNHDTAGWLPPATRFVMGASLKRYLVAGVPTFDLTLRDITNATDRATSTFTIAGADKTAAFNTSAWFGIALGKGGTLQVDFGVSKINYSSAVVLTAGNAWSQADADSVKTRIVTHASSQGHVNAVGLLTIYDTSASGDGWPTLWDGTNGTVIDWRLPTSDSTPLEWAPDSGTTHYTQVDDAFGSYSAADYVTDTTTGHVDEYGYTALSLSGKTVLCMGMTARCDNNVIVDLYIDYGGVISTIAASLGTATWGWWDKAPVAAPAGTRRPWAQVI